MRWGFPPSSTGRLNSLAPTSSVSMERNTPSGGGVSKMMKRLGLNYTKSTYTLAAADEENQKEFVETTFPEVKKHENGEIDHILFQDESMIRDYQALQYTWFEKGKQRIIKNQRQTSRCKTASHGRLCYG